MTCPTCDHTMEGISTDPPALVWQCPRCGTTIVKHFEIGGGGRSSRTDVYFPELIGRCRAFEKEIIAHMADPFPPKIWRRLGIAEAINLPAQRPQT